MLANIQMIYVEKAPCRVKTGIFKRTSLRAESRKSLRMYAQVVENC